MTNIFDAIENNDLEQLKKAIDECADVNAAIDGGYTPLFIAALKGHSEAVQYLLAKKDIDVNKADNEGDTPLYIAAQKGHSEIVKHLLEKKGIDVNAADKNGVTPLYAAAYNGHSKVVQLLVAKEGIDVNAPREYGATPLYVAAALGHSEVVKHLLEKIDVNKADNNGFTPLYAAAACGHSKVVQHLLAKEGIDVNATDNNGITPLIAAAQGGHVNIGAILLIHGANFDDVNSTFYKKAINHIAQGINDYDEYLLKKLVFTMVDHERLGSNSMVSEIIEDMKEYILDLAAPPKIELNKMQQQHRAAVEKRINELQQEKVAPGSNVAANGVITQISPAPHQL
jgi:ankyrin repeat protein